MLGLAAGFRVLGYPSITMVLVIECLVIAGLFVVSERFLAGAERHSWLTIVGAFSVTALALPAAGGLMETPLAVTLLVGGLSAFRCRRFTLSGVLLGLASATRFEMCVPALVAFLLAPGRTNRLHFVAGAGPIALALAVLLQRFYGLVLPHTMAAKATVYQLRRADLWSMGPQEFGKYSGTALATILCLTTVVGVLRIVGRDPRLPDESQRATVVLGSFPLILAAIYVWKAPLIFPWYWTLGLCTMALFAGVTAVDTATRESAAAGVSAVGAIAIASTLALVTACLISVGASVSGHLEASPWLTENHRTRTYLTIGQLLDHRCPRGVLAAPEIGALGWTFRGRILDGGGLASPEVLPYHPLRVPDERPSGGVGSIPGRAVAALQPDLLVSMELFASDFTNKTKVLPELSDYRLWWKEPVLAPDSHLTLPETLWGTRWTLVFSRHRSAQGVVGCSP